MKWFEYCYLHNPEISSEEKKLAQSKWGKVWTTTCVILSDPILLKWTYDVANLLVETINQVRSWKLDVKTANCLGMLCNYLMKAYEMTLLEDKLELIKGSLQR